MTGLQIRRTIAVLLLVTIAPHHSQKFLCRVLLKIPAVIFSSFEKLHFFGILDQPAPSYIVIRSFGRATDDITEKALPLFAALRTLPVAAAASILVTTYVLQQ